MTVSLALIMITNCELTLPLPTNVYGFPKEAL